MDPLWLLKGKPGARGWRQVQTDNAAETVDVLHFDPDRWVLLYAPRRPEGYEGLTASEPPDGLYLDQFGRPCYVAGRREVPNARAVIKALGQQAEQMLDKIGDPDLVLERLGRAF
jgi:hypothetical protein